MKNRMSTFALTVMTGLFAACTEVELCYDAHPHRSYLDFRFNWKEEYKDNHAESMKVVAVRPVNIYRYEFEVSANESDNKGRMVTPEDEAEEVRKLMLNGSLSPLPGGIGSNLWVRSGEYNFATFAWDSDKFSEEDSPFRNPDSESEEQEDLGSGFSSIPLSYREFSLDDPRVKGRYGDWIDYNPYAKYISSSPIPIYYAFVNHVNVPVPDGGSGKVTVDFTPELATQRITFRFDIEKTPDMIVDSLVAEISGIPSTIDLTSGLISADKTYKMLFQPKYQALTTKEDSVSATRLECSGYVDVTGIMRGYSDEMITGPGILQLGIYSHAQNDEGQTVRKIFRAGINLFHTLKDMKILEWDEEAQGYRQTCREAEILITSVLKVDRNGVVDEGSGSTGLDDWKNCGDVDLEVW